MLLKLNFHINPPFYPGNTARNKILQGMLGANLVGFQVQKNKKMQSICHHC